MPRTFTTWVWKDTNLRIACSDVDAVTQAVQHQRALLEQYIVKHPHFQTALEPTPVDDDAPDIVQRMAEAANLIGVGPMAAVAGTLSQVGVEAAMAADCTEAIVENGGDLFAVSDTEVTIAIHAGKDSGLNLAFALTPEDMPVAICSSSSKMGHSLSFGDCSLATVISANASLADAAATMVCNRIRSEDDVEPVLEQTGNIPGIQGILVVKDSNIGLWGKLPRIVRNHDASTAAKITRDRRSKPE